MSAPSVTTVAASGITSTTAQLNGQVNPNGLDTNAIFECAPPAIWSPGTPSQDTPAYDIGTSYSTLTYQYTITGLSPNTTYYFDAFCGNSDGLGRGVTLSFTTLPSGTVPTVTTDAATSIGANSAVLNGDANPLGNYTYGYFQYGLTTSYGYTTGEQGLGAYLNYDVPFSQSIPSGLTPNTTYYFRAVGTNGVGTAYGIGGSFRTLGAVPTVTTDAATSIGANSAVLNGDLTPNSVDTHGFFQWGTSTSYGNTTGSQDEGSGTSDVGFSQSIAGLTSGGTYHFRAVGTNSLGTTYGADRSFTTTSTAYGTGAGAISLSGSGYSGLHPPTTGSGYQNVTLGVTGTSPADPTTAVAIGAASSIGLNSALLGTQWETAPWTIEFWLQPVVQSATSSGPSQQTLLAQDTSLTHGVYVTLAGIDTPAFTPGTLLVQVGSYGPWSFASPLSVTDGNWHHLVIVASGTTGTVYLDGVAIGTQTVTLPAAVCKSAYLGGGFKGSLAYFAWYPGIALTQVQVADHLNRGLWGFVFQSSLQRVADVLAVLDWPTALTVIPADNAASMVQQPTGSLWLTTPLSYLQQIELAENGQLYADVSGHVVFLSRHWKQIYQPATPASVFGENPGEVGYKPGFVLSRDNLDLYNAALCQAAAGPLGRASASSPRRSTASTPSSPRRGCSSPRTSSA